MVRLEENKSFTEGKPIEALPIPSTVYIPIAQHLGKPCDKIEVKPGDQVLRGQRLAHAEAKIHAPIHSSVSGKVTAIQDWPHPVHGSSKTIIIESDGLDKPINQKEIKTSEQANKLTPEQIRDIVFVSGIVGLGGAAFPTHIKLNPPKPVDTLIVNIAECEPYLTSDSALVIEKTDEILKGIELVMKCLSATEVIIAIEDNKPESIKALQNSIRDTQYSIRILKSQYPQGGEKQLIKNILGKEVPRGKLPFDAGVNVQNVATIYAIYEAVYKNKPLYERVVTVTGSIITKPKNLLVRIGTPIKELIDFCAPLIEPIAKIIAGGPMMGLAQYTDTVPVIKCTSGILLFSRKEARMLEENVCIRCGACVRECPVGLMPCLINLVSLKNLWPETKEYGAMDCIECGICSYVCPSNRNLVQSIKRAKFELNR